jgi:hypothetical protein
MNMTIIFLDSTQKVRKVCNNPDFSQKQYFAGYVFKVSAWLSNHTVCKIGLKICALLAEGIYIWYRTNIT